MHNLLKMQRYQLLHNRTYWYGMLGVFLIGFVMAETYVPEVMGSTGGIAAATLTDIFNGMVYDSTFILILVSCLLALMFGQEFSNRTINLEICAGHNRQEVFFSKVVSYLVAFNLMAIIYPVAGCVREYMNFGIEDAGIFYYHVMKAVVASFLLNSAIFLIAIFFCCYFRQAAKAVAVTTIITFVLSLYLGYGMMVGLPVFFLPIFQIREAVNHIVFVRGSGLLVSFLWVTVLTALSWRTFYQCDLK